MKYSKKGIKALRAKYGIIFISPWLVGLLLFFLLPIGKSFFYSFSDVKLSEKGISASFIGLENFK